MNMGTSQHQIDAHESYILKAKAPASGILGLLYWIAYGFLFGLGGLYLIVGTLYDLYCQLKGALSFFTCFMALIILIIGLLCFRNFLISLIRSTRKCIIDPLGITVVNCTFLKKEYTWAEVSSIVVCDTNYRTSQRGDEYDFAIRMVIGKELHGPLSAEKSYAIFTTHVENWRALTYTRNHFRKIFLFEYTPEKYMAIQRISRLPIINCVSKETMKEFTAKYGELP